MALLGGEVGRPEFKVSFSYLERSEARLSTEALPEKNKRQALETDLTLPAVVREHTEEGRIQEQLLNVRRVQSELTHILSLLPPIPGLQKPHR